MRWNRSRNISHHIHEVRGCFRPIRICPGNDYKARPKAPLRIGPVYLNDIAKTRTVIQDAVLPRCADMSATNTREPVASEATHLSRTSSMSSIGVRSNTIRPGEPGDGGLSYLGRTGIENMLPGIHSPDSGTLNFCSSQMAVPSFSEFVDTQIRNSGG
jgi:hypothetical protein